MQIKLGYDIELEIPAPVPIIAVLNVHPSRMKDLLEPDYLRISPDVARDEYYDGFGNRCTRFLAPQGILRLSNSTLIEDSGEPDARDFNAVQIPVAQLPPDTLQFLVASRYCEVDRLSNIAWQLFGGYQKGWPLAEAICGWVHSHITFNYQAARPTMSALDVYTERQGVCRDFQHLAITMCRAMHIPARYATGYLGDICVPRSPDPMDFSAWFEVYLGGRWWTCDARHNQARVGRVLMGTGRDAADVAITTSFGPTWLRKFSVVTDEVMDQSDAANAQNSLAMSR
ncbi:MAG TPA: transglutaminase family protein [Bryobacteraceae bacterium]|jgi:transglutaminase-like putative cysteine protease|nr:transglutaminase family protein [Bryobacteraceae bacterium]